MHWFLLLLAIATLAAASPAHARPWSNAELDDLARAGMDASREGLPAPTQALELLDETRRAAALDPLLSPVRDGAADALFARLADLYARGGVDPAAVDRHWLMPRPAPPDLDALGLQLDAGASPNHLLQALLPQSFEYVALRQALADLDVSPGDDASARRMQLRANLERWRWLPRDLPPRRVEVRIAQFELALHRPGLAPEVHAVIVGARRSPSPVFGATIRSVTLNPAWTPPYSILANELLPRFRRNPAAAAREGFEVIDRDGRAVAPGAVDWRARPFPYTLRQAPGPDNALGRVRFDLPNPYAVFLHDTPARGLFARTERALSHGCIRVENPLQLAASLLESPDWDGALLQAAIDTGATETIPLATPTPVYILYLTAVAGEDGAVVYLEDFHGRDPALAAALDAPATTARLEPQPGLCAP